MIDSLYTSYPCFKLFKETCSTRTTLILFFTTSFFYEERRNFLSVKMNDTENVYGRSLAAISTCKGEFTFVPSRLLLLNLRANFSFFLKKL